MLARNGEDERAGQIVAEALLCRGLERDDPWALEAALGGFRARLSSHPGDFFARLYVAEAMRRRYPLAGETTAAFERARAVLDTAGVGAARATLRAHVEEELAGVRAYREQFLPLLRTRAAELQRGPLAPARLAELLTLLAQTGPAGIERARAILEAELARQPNIALDTFYRAEIQRGRESPQEAARLYRAAATALCDEAEGTPANECQRARWRLEELEATPERKEGG